MKKVIGILILMIGCLIHLTAQRDQTLFSENGVRVTGIWVGPNLSGTLAEKKIVRQTGGQFALEFNKRLLVGFGTNAVDYPTINGGQIDFTYNGLLFGLTPRSYKAIHPTFTILAGGGNFGFTNSTNKEKNDIWMAQSTLGLEFNVFRWFRIGLSGGYRRGFFINEKFSGVSNSDISAPFGTVNFKFGFSWAE